MSQERSNGDPWVITAILLVMFVATAIKVNSEAYVVVNNADNSIHTVAEKPNDVLRPSQSRYVIEEYLPGFDNEFHYWNPQSKLIMRKTNPQILAITESRQEQQNKQRIAEAAKNLILLERAEQLDPNRSYTAEKQKQLDVIEAYKKK